MSKTSTAPIGANIADDSSADYERSAEYRAEWDRQAFAFSVAKMVYERRTGLGLTQENLAERAGTTGSAISRIESGRHTASILSLQKVAAALNAHLVVTFEDESPSVAVA